MQARYYDPILGRFYGNDPVGFQAGTGHSFNRYAYVANNPYAYNDPNGEWLNFAIGGALGALEDIAFQGIMMALGAQDEFSYSSVAMSTGLGVATSGVSAYAQGGRLAMAAGKLGKKILGKGDDVAKKGFDSTGRVIIKNGEAVTIRGKQVSPHAIEQAVKRGVPPKEILKALDQGVPKAKQSLGEATIVRKGPKAIVTTKENDTIITTIIGKQRPQF